jgi:hypothetical protein
MKRTKWVLPGLMALLIIGLTVPSCSKKSTTDEEITTASDNANAEHIVSDITTIAAQASDGATALASYKTIQTYDQVLAGSCATVTVSGQIITIAFTSGTVCADGRSRSGTLTLDYSASTNGATHYRDPGFSCKVTSSNYVVDGNQVNISNKTITNNTLVGFNPNSTNLTWAISASVTIIKNGGGTITWNCSRTKYLLNTNDTAIYHGASRPISWSRARVGLNGTASGVSASGISFSASIIQMLIRDFGACTIQGKHPIIEGKISYTPSGHPARIIDYGNGTCDLNATITVNGSTHPITLN